MSGIKTTIIEINQQRCEFLSEQLPKATILCGDATDKELLSEECIEKAAGFAALTDLDEENILLSLVCEWNLFRKDSDKGKPH